MSLPTSAALDACLARIEDSRLDTDLLQLQFDLAELRRLQHEASTAPKVRVLDLEAARRLREEAGMACHDDTDPAA